MIYPNDPEGLFTNLSAFLNAFAGYTFCLVMMDNKGDINKVMKLWVIASLVMGAMVYPLTLMMPLNKKIWSISFVFITSAVSGLSLTFITFFVDVLGGKHPKYGRIINTVTTPFIWLGRNPLAIFILMDVLAIIMIKYIIVDEKSAWAHFYHYVFASWIDNKEVASTIYACFFAILWTAVAALLFKFNIFIRLWPWLAWNCFDIFILTQSSLFPYESYFTEYFTFLLGPSSINIIIFAWTSHCWKENRARARQRSPGNLLEWGWLFCKLKKLGENVKTILGEKRSPASNRKVILCITTAAQTIRRRI